MDMISNVSVEVLLPSEEDKNNSKPKGLESNLNVGDLAFEQD